MDDDVRNGGDTLSYAWTFSSPEYIQVDTTEENNKRLTITVNEP